MKVLLFTRTSSDEQPQITENTVELTNRPVAGDYLVWGKNGHWFLVEAVVLIAVEGPDVEAEVYLLDTGGHSFAKLGKVTSKPKSPEEIMGYYEKAAKKVQER